MKKKILIIVYFCGLIFSCQPDTLLSEEEEKEENPIYLNEHQLKNTHLAIETIQIQNWGPHVLVKGKILIDPQNKAKIITLYPGIVEKIFVHEGDRVKKGTTLIRIQHPQVLQIQENYLNIKDQIQFAQEELKRQKALFSAEATAQKKIQTAQMDYQSLLYRKMALEKELFWMNIIPDKIKANELQTSMSIQSPIDGIVSDFEIELGTFIDPQSSLGTIINPEKAHLELEVFEKDVHKLKINQEIIFRLQGEKNSRYPAKIKGIGGSFEKGKKIVKIHADIEKIPLHFIDQATVWAQIQLENYLTITVPTSAIAQIEGKNYIFLAQEKDEEGGQLFEKFPIITKDKDINRTAIEGLERALEEGEKIVTQGVFWLRAKALENKDREHMH